MCSSLKIGALERKFEGLKQNFVHREQSKFTEESGNRIEKDFLKFQEVSFGITVKILEDTEHIIYTME